MKQMLARVTVVAVTALAVLLVAAPAFAAEEGKESPIVGGPDGLVMGLILGGLIGLIIFVDVFTGEGPDEMPELPREH